MPSPIVVPDLVAKLVSTGLILDRDKCRPDIFTFQAAFSAASPPVITQPGPLNVPDGWWFAITQIGGFWQDPATNAPDIAKVSFSISDPGEGRNFFQNNTPLARIVSPQNGAGEMKLGDGLAMVLPKAARINVQFVVDIASGAWAGAHLGGITLEGYRIKEEFGALCGLVQG